MKTYKLVSRMNSKFESFGGGYCQRVDVTNKDCEISMKHLKVFHDLFGKGRSFLSYGDYRHGPSVIKTLIDKYSYYFSVSYTHSENNNWAELIIHVKTNMLGKHLENCLEFIYEDILSLHDNFSGWIEESGAEVVGWSNVKPKDLYECPHVSTARLTIMSDNGVPVEILECDKCKKLIKREIE